MRSLLLAALLTMPAAAGAHEIWIERDGNGPARIYLGEPAEPMPPGGDPEFAKLKAPRLLPAPEAAPKRRAGYLEAAVPAGDVRLSDDAVFAPWGEPGRREGVIYYARAGRREARAALPVELVPVTAGASVFRLVRDGRPVAATKVTAVAPDRSTRELVTDADGRVDLGAPVPGRHLLAAALREEGRHRVAAGPVDVLHRITTTSFTVP